VREVRGEEEEVRGVQEGEGMWSVEMRDSLEVPATIALATSQVKI
jgi:hypothetical protein